MKNNILIFLRNEKRRSNNITMARVQQCLRILGINLRYNNVKEIWPRNITERIIALKIHNNHFVRYGNLKVLVLIKLLKK